MNAIVCDDDPVARRVLREMVAAHGFHVVSEVTLAIDAIRMVGKLKPALLLLDVSMPGMSGLEALSAVAGASPGTAVVLVTAHELTADGGRLAGAHGLVDKTNLARLDDVLTGIAPVRQAAWTTSRSRTTSPTAS